jgi:DUF177 domain-containing protein
MPLKAEVRSLFESLSAARTVSGEITLPDVELGEQPYHFEGPVRFDVTLTNVGTGIVASGTAVASVKTPCVRCLCDTCLEFEAEVEGFYVLPGDAEGLPEEQEFEYIAADMSVDLEPVISASLVVELPFAPVHDPDCKGICPACGGDLNISACDCRAAAPPSPFDALKELRVESGPDS